LDGRVRYGVAQDTFLDTALGHVRDRKLDLAIFSD